MLLGRVGSLEAGERVKESARGTLCLSVFPSSQAHLLFSPIHLPHPLGTSAEERVLEGSGRGEGGGSESRIMG